MPIVLFAPGDFPIDEVATVLNEYDLDVVSLQLDSSLRNAGLSVQVDKAIAVIPKQGVVDVGEEVSSLRELIGSEPSLLLCTAQPSSRRILHECGASQVITPRSWTAAHVAERILAEFILDGSIHPLHCGSLRGGTPQMRELYRHIDKLAPISETILILGENGTGKGLVAKEIHERSGRPNPFLPVNCPQHSRELLPSELFGHERGAFTGATQARRGLLAEAQSGTVFLDEIGELDLAAQAQLLHVIEEGEVMRVGGSRWEKIQARIVLATNRNLTEECAAGRFRMDLYQRIRGFALEVPPLRERMPDIPLLASHFVSEYNTEHKTNLTAAPGSVECLFRYDWPGNVRELRLMIRKAAIYADAPTGHISAAVLQESVRTRESSRPAHSVSFNPAMDSWRDFVDRAEAAYFRAVLAEAGGNVTRAAELAGLSRSQFYKKLEEIRAARARPDQ
ncbi:MAG: sigma-54 dependent transcriptional regulator [Acidobacteriota bacterium]